MHLASYQKILSNEKVQCLLCPHSCILDSNQRGLCNVRENRGGALWTYAYNNPCSMAFDPIEKKPLYHFHPGKKILSLATGGCNFKCLNCQNASISQTFPENLSTQIWTPAALIRLAKKEKLDLIAFTYTEPTVFFEYMLAVAQLAKQSACKTVLISNGYIQRAPLLELLPYLDAANIDLKSLNDAVYRQLSGGRLQPVLDALLVLRDSPVWLEISHLLIPGFSDDAASVKRLCQWLVSHNFEDVPLHLSRFYPHHKLSDTASTTDKNMLRAYKIAKDAGLHYVYMGNASGLNGENTYCPNCGQLVVGRNGYRIESNQIYHGQCTSCGKPISGFFDWSFSPKTSVLKQ